MPEHPEAPDRIFVDGKDGDFFAHGFVYGEGLVMTEEPYLRSTPARLAAEQMLEALKAVHARTAGPWSFSAQVAAAIAAAQGGENG